MTAKLKTAEDVLTYLQEVGICTLFSTKTSRIPALRNVVDQPARPGGESKWGARVEAIWRWKNELPATHPDEVFYGKIKGGHAVLMSMDHPRQVHYPAAHLPLNKCSDLARKIHEIIRLDPAETPEIRATAMERFHCTKSRFDSALKQLQITLNITRTNDPRDANDHWVVWSEQYPDIGSAV